MKKNQSTELISVVVPTYNRGEMLSKCVASITNQSYANLEIIIVDANSIDETANICNRLVLSDKRIKYYNIENKGVVSQRSFGILKATGDYVSCIDSDDEVSNVYIERLFSVLKSADADISICYSSKKKENTACDCIPKIVPCNESSFRNISKSFKKMSPVCKLYKREIVQKACTDFYNNKHNDFSRYEDLILSYATFLLSKRVATIRDELYYVNDSPNSISKTEISLKQLAINFNLFNLLNEIVFSYTKHKFFRQNAIFFFYDLRSHLVDYYKNNSKNLVKIRFKYLRKKYKKIIEKTTLFCGLCKSDMIILFSLKFNLFFIFDVICYKISK